MHKLQMLVLIAIATLGAQFQAGPAQAQAGQDTATKLIDVQLATQNLWESVWITKVEIGNQFLLNEYDLYNPPLPGEVVPGKDFIAGNDWLKHTTLYVINRTNQPIAWLSIALKFPQTGNGQTQPVWVYNIQMGRIPDLDAVNVRGEPFPPGPPGSKALGLQPGGRLAIHVSDYIDKIEDYVKTAMPISAINEANIYVETCALEDGLRFTGGGYSRPDPQRPGKWIYLSVRQYFPGNKVQYLPNVVTQRGERPPQQ